MDATTAVLAHGILNAVHVVKSVPALLDGCTDEDERHRLCSMLSHQLDFLVGTLEDLGDAASEGLRRELHRASFAGAEVAAACTGGALAEAGDQLQTLADAAERAAANLTGLVQGLPTEVILYLDELESTRQ